MNSPAVDIAELLSNSTGMGLVIGADLFVNKMPSSPDKLIAINDSGGYNPLLTLNILEVCYYPTVQIMVRGNKQNYLETYSLCDQVKSFLHGKSQIWIGTTRYVLITSESDIISLGYDDNNRPLLSCNFLIDRT